METFNREIFDSMIDKVIIGTKDENGDNPYIAKFIYSNGYEDCIDMSNKHGLVSGEKVKIETISQNGDEIPFDGTQDMVERQKGLLKNLLNQGVLNKAAYDKSITKINQAIDSANTIMESCGRWALMGKNVEVIKAHNPDDDLTDGVKKRVAAYCLVS